jgi:hypothetical protein
VAPLGIDPGTSRIAAQCLNHYATPGTTEERNYKKQIKEEDNHIYRCFQGGIVRKEVCGKIIEVKKERKKICFLDGFLCVKIPISKGALNRHKTNIEGVKFQYDRFTTEINKLRINV